MFPYRSGRGLKRWLATVVLVALCVAYVLPDHLSAGRDVPLDVLLHVGFFAICGAGLVWAFARLVPLWVLAVLAFGLEYAQWRIAGFAHIEWGDIASNEGGVVVAWMAGWCWFHRRAAM
ncbi:MAG TPA: hypothetical protein VF269_07085 [Rhodanobacteraceae bacterium]